MSPSKPRCLSHGQKCVGPWGTIRQHTGIHGTVGGWRLRGKPGARTQGSWGGGDGGEDERSLSGLNKDILELLNGWLSAPSHERPPPQLSNLPPGPGPRTRATAPRHCALIRDGLGGPPRLPRGTPPPTPKPVPHASSPRSLCTCTAPTAQQRCSTLTPRGIPACVPAARGPSLGSPPEHKLLR